MISELNERSRAIFRTIVDTYLATGEPVGSQTISRASGLGLSPASIRNTMAELEHIGLLFAPHTSAGRMPTDHGIRLYIDGLMQTGHLDPGDRHQIEAACTARGRPVTEVLEQATSLLSGLSACAGLVVAPKMNGNVKQVQFVPLGPAKIMAILVFQNGLVENRILEMDEDIQPSSLIAATNYLNAKLAGKTIAEAEKNILLDMTDSRTQLDLITRRLVEKGIAVPPEQQQGHIIIRGQSQLLQDLKAIEDLERARQLLGFLEKQQNMLELLGSIHAAQGVQIFIGAENKIFDQSGWSLIIAPYKNAQEQIVGAIGVIGPTRLDYDRIIPMVDYTSQVVSKLVDGG